MRRKREVISPHDSRQEAIDALALIDVESSKWGCLDVVSPGETIEGTLEKPIETPSMKSRREAEEAKLPWLLSESSN